MSRKLLWISVLCLGCHTSQPTGNTAQMASEETLGSDYRRFQVVPQEGSKHSEGFFDEEHDVLLLAHIDTSPNSPEYSLKMSRLSGMRDIPIYRYLDLIGATLQVNQDADVDFSIAIGAELGVLLWYPPDIGSITFQYEDGVNQFGDGDGTKFTARLRKPSSDIFVELAIEHIEHELMFIRRIMAGVSYEIVRRHRPSAPWSIDGIAGLWCRTSGNTPIPHELGWYGELNIMPPYAKGFQLQPWFRVLHDSLFGTSLEVSIGDRQDTGIRVGLGYSWMDWGEGMTGSLIWRF